MPRAKRLLAALTIAGLLVGASGLAAAFPDTTGTRFSDAANRLRGLGVLVGDPDGNLYPFRTITRAEAAKIIVAILGLYHLAEAYGGVAAFPDTAGHWANGFVGVAKDRGIINGFPDGTFRPQDTVTYAQMAKMLLEASGHGPQASLAWPDNYMVVAQAKGLFGGIPSHDANTSALRGDCAMMAAHTVYNVLSPSGDTIADSVFGQVAILEVLPGHAHAAAGTGVQISAVPRTEAGTAVAGIPVAYTTSNRANSSVTQTGLFSSPIPGTYTVTARSAGLVETATISVFGGATGLRATPSATQLSATGAAKVTISVEVVDAGGRRVANDSATQVTMDYATGGNNGAVTLGTATKTVAAGVATFEVTSTVNEDRADTLEFTATGLAKAQTTLSTVTQVPTSLRLSASPETLRANSVTTAEVTATVLDQSGAPVTGGVIVLTYSITGPGTFGGGVTTPQTAVTTTGSASIDVYSIQGSPGNVVVTAAAEGLTAGQVSISSYFSGTASAIRPAVSDHSITATDVGVDANVATLRIELVDTGGQLATRTTPLVIDLLLANGDSLVEVGLEAFGSTAIPAGQSRTSEIVIAAIDGMSGKAGTHTIKAIPSDSAFSPVTFNLTVLPGAIAALTMAPEENIKLPITTPHATYVVQLADAAGNAVSTAGLEVTAGWQDLGTVNQGKPTLNGVLNPPSDPNGSAVKVVTDALGKAVFNFSAQGYLGDDYRLVFRHGAVTASSGTIAVASNVASDLEIAVTTPTGANLNALKAEYGNRAHLMVLVKDLFGNALADWPVVITFSSEGENVKVTDVVAGSVVQPYTRGAVTLRSGSDGRVGLEFQGGQAGPLNITATATGLAQPLTRSKPFRVDRGITVASVLVTTVTGVKATSVDVQANEAVELRLVPADNGGNPILSPIDLDVLLHQVEGLYTTGSSGEFRLTASGVGLAQGANIRLARGSAHKSIWYVQPATQSGVAFGLDGSATAYRGYVLSLVSTETEATPTPRNLVTFEVRDVTGNPASNVRISAHVSAGTLAQTAITTGSTGRFTLTWSNGAGGQLNIWLEDAILGDGASRPELAIPWTNP